MVIACSVVMLGGANSHWVSLLRPCKPKDDVAEFTGGWVGRQEESDD